MSRKILLKKYGNYQMILTFAMITMSLSLPYFIYALPTMQTVSSFTYIDDQGNKNLIQDSTEFCAQHGNRVDLMSDRIIIDEKDISNWASQLKLVCNSRKRFAFSASVFFISSIIGSILMIKLPDLYGRRKIFLILNALVLVFLYQTVFLYHFYQILIMAFVCGFASFNLSLSSIMINENIESKYSGLIMGITNSMYPLGGLLNVTFLHYFNDWRYYYVFLLMLFTISFIVSYFYLEESPEWLKANVKLDEYQITTERILNLNKLEVIASPSPLLNRRVSETLINESQKINYSVFDIYRYKSISGTSFIMSVLWMISGFCFFGLFLNLDQLTGNVFTDSIISFSAQLIAELTTGAISYSIGRKNTTIITFLLACVGSFFFHLTNIYYANWISKIFIFIASLGIAGTFNLMYIYTPELYPVNVRSISMNTFSILNRLSASLVPYILLFSSKMMLMTSILCGIGFELTTYLIETRDYNPGNEIKEKQKQHSIEYDKIMSSI